MYALKKNSIYFPITFLNLPTQHQDPTPITRTTPTNPISITDSIGPITDREKKADAPDNYTQGENDSEN